MNDIEKALRCLSSQTAEGDCYCDYYNFMNPDKPKMVCQKETYGSELVCPYFQNEYSVCFEDGECGEWLETAANLIAELQQYRQIGTLEECREAREKQKTQKVSGVKGDKLKFGTCPVCNRRISDAEGGNYCQNCGQKLDWRKRK